MRTRRSRALLSVACLAVLVTAGCTRPAGGPSGPATAPTGGPEPTSTGSSPGGSPDAGPSATATPSASATPTSSAGSAGSCAALAASLPLADQVGQLFLVGLSSTGLRDGDPDFLADTRAGSVIFLGNSTAGQASVRRLTARVRDAARQPEGVRVLVSVDQEGGQVQRLRGPGFARIPSAREQAGLGDRELAERAERWGRELREVDVDADLAPVADLVPGRLERVNQPIGRLDRGYGPDPDVIAGAVTAFVTGMDRAGVATAVKHFPGLGRVRGNTDLDPEVVDDTTTRDDAGLRGFRAAVDAGVDMVMLSSAYYRRIDPDTRAAFSSVVIGRLLRGDLGFSGVVVSDDLAASAYADLSPGPLALRFLRAGGDLVIAGEPERARRMVAAVLDEARSDAAFRAQLQVKVARVLALKARRGLADCG